jgi:anti-anti-sigma factor
MLIGQFKALLWYPSRIHKEQAMTITVEFSGPIAIIILLGGIDYSKQEEFLNANTQALSADQIREIHVDFSQATFLDSSAIRALIQLQKEADSRGKPLVLLNCNDNMRDVFEIGGFDRLFTFRTNP